VVIIYDGELWEIIDGSIKGIDSSLLADLKDSQPNRIIMIQKCSDSRIKGNISLRNIQLVN